MTQPPDGDRPVIAAAVIVRAAGFSLFVAGSRGQLVLAVSCGRGRGRARRLGEAAVRETAEELGSRSPR